MPADCEDFALTDSYWCCKSTVHGQEGNQGIYTACKPLIKALLSPLESAASFHQYNTKLEFEGNPVKCLHGSRDKQRLLVNSTVPAVRSDLSKTTYDLPSKAGTA